MARAELAPNPIATEILEPAGRVITVGATAPIPTLADSPADGFGGFDDNGLHVVAANVFDPSRNFRYVEGGGTKTVNGSELLQQYQASFADFAPRSAKRESSFRGNWLPNKKRVELEQAADSYWAVRRRVAESIADLLSTKGYGEENIRQVNFAQDKMQAYLLAGQVSAQAQKRTKVNSDGNWFQKQQARFLSWYKKGTDEPGYTKGAGLTANVKAMAKKTLKMVPRGAVIGAFGLPIGVAAAVAAPVTVGVVGAAGIGAIGWTGNRFARAFLGAKIDQEGHKVDLADEQAEKRFDSHEAAIDHVYSTHTTGTGVNYYDSHDDKGRIDGALINPTEEAAKSSRRRFYTKLGATAVMGSLAFGAAELAQLVFADDSGGAGDVSKPPTKGGTPPSGPGGTPPGDKSGVPGSAGTGRSGPGAGNTPPAKGDSGGLINIKFGDGASFNFGGASSSLAPNNFGNGQRSGTLGVGGNRLQSDQNAHILGRAGILKLHPELAGLQVDKGDGFVSSLQEQYALTPEQAQAAYRHMYGDLKGAKGTYNYAPGDIRISHAGDFYLPEDAQLKLRHYLHRIDKLPQSHTRAEAMATVGRNADGSLMANLPGATGSSSSTSLGANSLYSDGSINNQVIINKGSKGNITQGAHGSYGIPGSETNPGQAGGTAGTPDHQTGYPLTGNAADSRQAGKGQGITVETKGIANMSPDIKVNHMLKDLLDGSVKLSVNPSAIGSEVDKAISKYFPDLPDLKVKLHDPVTEYAQAGIPKPGEGQPNPASNSETLTKLSALQGEIHDIVSKATGQKIAPNAADTSTFDPNLTTEQIGKVQKLANTVFNDRAKLDGDIGALGIDKLSNKLVGQIETQISSPLGEETEQIIKRVLSQTPPAPGAAYPSAEVLEELYQSIEKDRSLAAGDN